MKVRAIVLFFTTMIVWFALIFVLCLLLFNQVIDLPMFGVFSICLHADFFISFELCVRWDTLELTEEEEIEE
jgi:hypothetical protein